MIDGFAAQSPKPRSNEDDYMGLVQKPIVGSNDSYKPSWPKTDVVPPMLVGKSNAAYNTVEDSKLRRPMPGASHVVRDSLSDAANNPNKDYGGAVVPGLASKPLSGGRGQGVSAPAGPVPDVAIGHV